MRRHDFLRDGEPKAGAARTRRSGKGAEQILHGARRHAGTIVIHLDPHRRCCGQSNGNGGRTGIKRVAYKIGKYPEQFLAIRRDTDIRGHINRHVRGPGAGQRPEVLAQPPVLAVDAGQRDAAARAKAAVAERLRAGIEASGTGDDATARATLQQVRAEAPGEPLVAYYLGLIALRQGDEAAALQQLQQYAREDPEGAAQREVPKTLTLLASAQLQQEVKTAVAREAQVVSTPPEPGSIAVQAFVNRGDENYRAMAKGLAAMIIADLSKVPGLKVLEREKVQLLLDEAQLGDAGLADPASAVRSGRLMRAEKVIVGNFEVQ